MSWCSFNANDTLNGLLSKDGVAKTTGHVRELLVVTPLNLPLVTLIVIIMARSWPVLKSLLMVDLLSLGEPRASGLSPSVVELEVDVFQVAVSTFAVGDLIELGWDVALLFQVIGTDLSNVHINHVGVVSINLNHLILVVSIHIDVVAWADVLVGQNHLGLSVLVAWGVHVPQLHVASLFLLIHLKEEVLLRHNLLVGALSQLFAIYLVLELDQADLLLNNLVDALANASQVL